MTRSQTSSFTITATLFAAALLAAATIATPAAAEPVADACDTATVSAHQAERITGSLMRDYGYTSRKVSPWSFFIRDTKCTNGRWIVKLDVRTGNWIKKQAVVSVNCHTGEAELA